MGSLDIRLVLFAALNERRRDGMDFQLPQLAKLMSKIDCQGGNTQIGKVLSEQRREAIASACCAAVVARRRPRQGRRSMTSAPRPVNSAYSRCRCSCSSEGHDAAAEQAFREIARPTGGAWCRFDPGAAAQFVLLRAQYSPPAAAKRC